jgi:hypothetical protein
MAPRAGLPRKQLVKAMFAPRPLHLWRSSEEDQMSADDERAAQADADAEWEAEARKDHGHWCPIKCHVCRALCLLDAARLALAQAQADLALFEQQIVDQAEALGQQKAEVLARTRRIMELEKDLDLHIGMHAVTVGEYEKLKTTLAERDAEIARLGLEKQAGDEIIFGLRQQVDELKAKVAPPSSASALEIATGIVSNYVAAIGEDSFTNYEYDLQGDIASAIEAAEARVRITPGPGALEATRDLFESLEGWRPTDDWTGVPGHLKLLFDRTLHAIKAAEARGRLSQKSD